MKNISVIAEIYNEEDRIENFIKCFLWSNDIIIIDKSSTDNTRKIINKYISNSVHLIEVPYTAGASINSQRGVDVSINDWIMPITASDLIDPELVKKIKELIDTLDKAYSEIWVPYKMYVFGICDKHSPWHAEYKPLVYKKSDFIFSNKVHEERHSKGERYIYTNKNFGFYYHLTHRNLEIFYERHIRYTNLETEKYKNPIKAKRKTFRDILNAIRGCVFPLMTFRMGWDGIALALAYISYFIMQYLSVWQKFNAKGEKTYLHLSNEILNKWEKSDKCI
jgi:glycosyltransferase involved in cell wall biosynthesis